MSLHKISHGIDFSSKEWRDYCLWRNYSFTGFNSLDSSLRDSFFSPACDEDWNYAVINGDFVTDIIGDDAYAFAVAKKLGAKELLNFDAIENEVADKVIGYDILDGGYSYSLLTNFGNDISVVNDCLARNGLIRHKAQAMVVHKWFLENMSRDGHVLGSKIFSVYKATIL